jgi:hypothetical protein
MARLASIVGTAPALRGGAVFLVVPLLLAGCDSDLPLATEVISMRMLGARLEVIDAEERTTPKPGERLRVSMPIVFPTLERDVGELTSMIIGCTAPDRFTGGLPVCQELIDAALAGDEVADALPMIEGERLHCSDLSAPRRAQRDAVSLQCVNDAPVAVLDVPSGFDADALLMLGVVCERGDPYIEPLDPALFGCEDNDGGEIIRLQGFLTVQQRERDRNLNPSLDALTVLREGVEWLAPDPEMLPPEEGCADDVPEGDPALHSVVPGAHAITLRYDASEREEVEGEPEDLELTVYTTAGEMERRFTLFDGSDPGEDGVLEGALEWDPPKPADIPTAGQLVRFFITIRDQRGGFALTERAVCVR